MNRKRNLPTFFLLFAIAALVMIILPLNTLAQEVNTQGAADGAGTLGSTFTYQRLLNDDGAPANGSYNFRF